MIGMWFSKKRIYMDFAAATPLDEGVFAEMKRGFNAYGNPSAPHAEGRYAKELLEEARTRIARTLSVKSHNLIFTGSGTESNNLAISGVLEALVKRGMKPEDMHVVASSFEHPSLEEVLQYWERRGVAISFVQPTEEGRITPEAVKKCIRPETVLVSIVAVQSEIGQIQPLKDIARMLEEVRVARTQTAQKFSPESFFPIFHSDACQSPLFLDLSPDRLGVDCATYDAQKIMGPKGVGLLYKHSAVPLVPLIRGGKQERGFRPGTENVAGALGMAHAFEHAHSGRDERVKKVSALRDYCVSLLTSELPHIEINGGMNHRIANNINISIPGADGDYLAVLMDKEGVAVSPRSACIASDTPSRAVSVLGKSDTQARGTLRFTFGPNVKKKEVEEAVSALKRVLAIVDFK